MNLGNKTGRATIGYKSHERSNKYDPGMLMLPAETNKLYKLWGAKAWESR